MGRAGCAQRERQSRLSLFGLRRPAGPASSPSFPGFLSRLPRAAARLALAALLLAGAGGLATPAFSQSDTTAPSVSSAEVTAAKPKELVIDFDEALDTGSVPAASQFTVKIGGSTTGAPSVSSVAIDGDKVKLALAVALDAGQTSVTVDYTNPGTANDPLKDAADNEVATFTNRAVTNNAPACPTGQPAAAFWTACVTVGKHPTINVFGYLETYGALSPTRFTAGSTAFTVVNVRVFSDGRLQISFSGGNPVAAGSGSWVLQVGGVSLAMSDATFISRLNLYSWTSPGITWAAANIGDKVSVSLRKPGVGLTFSPTAVDVDEGDTADYTVKLAAAPSASVTVDIATDDAGAATVAPTSLTFTTMNWNTARTVTVTGVGDADADDETVTLTHSGNGVETDTVAVSVDDDEIGLVFSSTDVTVDEGDTADYTVALAERPDASVTVAIASGDTTAATVRPTSLTFTRMSWNTAQTVTVTGVEDTDDDHETLALTHTASGVGTATVEVRMRDDEAASSMFIFSQSEFEIRQRRTAKYTIRLREQPSTRGSVHIWTLKSSRCQGAGRERCNANHNPVSVKPPFVKFDRTNWNVPQEVTLRATGATDNKDELGVVLRHRWWFGSNRGEDRTVRVDVLGNADACPHGLRSGTFWTACLTVGSSGGKLGYSSGAGSLTDTTFEYGGTSYTIEGLYLKGGRMYFDLDRDAGSVRAEWALTDVMTFADFAALPGNNLQQTTFTGIGWDAWDSTTHKMSVPSSRGWQDGHRISVGLLPMERVLLRARMSLSLNEPRSPERPGKPGWSLSVPDKPVRNPWSLESPGRSVGRTAESGADAAGCSVDVTIEFVDDDGNRVAVDTLAASDFTVENGSVGTPVRASNGRRWTVPARATPGFTGVMRVRLPATERWRATEQAVRVGGDGSCGAAAKNALASLVLDGLALAPAFDPATGSYTADAPAETARTTVTAATAWEAASFAVAPADADPETDGHQVALPAGETEVTVTVTPDGGGDAKTYTVTVTRAAQPVAPAVAATRVPAGWSLIPEGVGPGERFRLLIVTSTRRSATATDILEYNRHVRTAAGAGHADIRAHGAAFGVLGCTGEVDARTNTGTGWSAGDRGVPVWWLGGAKVADDYADLYDGRWASTERRDESGAVSSHPKVFTGCAGDGTTGDEMGRRWVDIGRPGRSGGELNDGGTHTLRSMLRPLYGLSPVFEVAPAPGAPVAGAQAGDGAVTLTWEAPEYEGTITGWQVRHGAVDAATDAVAWGEWTAVEDATAETVSHTVTGLDNGTAYGFELRAMAGAAAGAASAPVRATPAAPEPLVTRMSGSVPANVGGVRKGRPGAPESGRYGGCAVEVSVEFLGEGGAPVAVAGLAATDFAAESGRVGAPMAGEEGLRWTVPARAATGFAGLMRVGLAATERWKADEQVFRVERDGGCAPVARNALASLALDGLALEPAFDAGTAAYAAAAPAGQDVVTVKAAAAYGAAALAVAPADADEEAQGHQVALGRDATEVTVTVTPDGGEADDAASWTVTVTRAAAPDPGPLTGFVLVDASDDADLGAIADGATVTVSPDGSYGIRAEVGEGETVGSVALSLTGPSGDTHERTEGTPPYSLYGDANGGRERGRALAAGSYTLTASAYARKGGQGEALGTLEVSFTVAVEAPVTAPSAGVLTGFTLVRIADQSTQARLTDGATIDLAARWDEAFGIRADIDPDASVGSVTLSLAGAVTVSRTEGTVPYSLYSDEDDGAGGRAMHGAALPAGSYTLSATAHAQRRGEGATLGTRSVSFRVVAPPALSVADASAEEGVDATLDFAVTLDREAAHTVTVAYATSDETATSGSDYTATSGTLSFAPGETEKTVPVPVLEDLIDEGSETLTLRLSSPSGAVIADGEATGTITNDDPIPQAWLARFGRTVTGQVLDAVEARLAAPRAAGAQAALAGQALPSWRGGDGAVANDNAASEASLLAEAEDRRALAAMTAWLAQTGPDAGPGSGTGFGPVVGGTGREPESRALTGRDFVTGTSFALTGGSAEGGGFASLWGRGSIAGFDGREGSLTVNGEVTTGLIGADWASAPASGSGAGGWTAGLALGHSTGTGGWRRGGACDLNCAGSIDATLSGLYPYAGVDLTDRLSLWAAAGWGAGEVTVTPDGRPGLTADLSMAMGAAGARSEVLRPEGGDGLTLAVKGDARFTRTSSDAVSGEGGNLAAAEADVWLVRIGVEGSRPVALGEDGATLVPSFELALRRDGGDAETGFGADLGGGIAFADPASGVALDAKARGLVAHESPGFREWGASLAASWDPRPSTDRGLSLTLRQSWGASPAGGMDALLSRETLADLAANDEDGGDGFRASSRLEGELGYGVAMFGGAFTGTPNLGFGLSDGGARDWRLGWRLTSAVRGDPGFEVSLDATRTEPANDEEPVHGVMLRAGIQW